MNMLVSASGLLVASLAFTVYDLITFRVELMRNLSTQAQIVASNSVSALVFNDADAAGITLAALEAAPDIVSAHTYRIDGRLFASYWRDGVAGTPPALRFPAAQEAEVSRFRLSSAALTRRVFSDGMPVGVVSIASDLVPLYARLWRSAFIALGVLVGAWVAALLVSRRSQRMIAEPLIDLAGIARRVSDGRDYSARAQLRGSDYEIATLIDAFNDMLAQIQERDRSLHEAQVNLEQRVTDRTAALHAANEELEAFSYSVSHDLRAPLRHVTGFASLLEGQLGPALDPKARRYLQTITDAAGRMAALIDNLLEFSRMGRAPVSKRRVDLTDVLREAMTEVAAQLNGRRIIWTLPPLPTVDADPALLRQVFVNLLSNAVKYTGTRAEARIEVGVADGAEGEVVIFVRDNGVGFDMAYAHKLFGVFQRLHRSEEFPGTGIGLANVRRIVQRHGGRAWAESALDAGATFYFSLPVDAVVTQGASHAA
jgi:signal transduction histidine kinase